MKGIVHVGSFRNAQLPFAIRKVVKGENGERIIEGVKPFDPALSHIPLTVMVNGTPRALTRDERANMAAEIEIKRQRAEKRAAKGKPVKAPKVKEEAVKVSLEAAAEASSPTFTVKKGGKWVQSSESGLYGKTG